MKPTPLVRNAEIIEDPVHQETLTQRYTAEAISFIERSKNNPFFLYLAHTMPHIPLHVSDRFKGKSAAGLYGDVVQELDWSVGEVLGTIRRLRLERDTVVVFSSDNGPWFQGSPGPLRGRKGSTHEGGVRVPGIVWGPGRVPARAVSAEPAATIDFFPTALALAGEPNPGSASQLPLDGKNILPLLTGQDQKSSHDLLLFFDGVYLQAVRSGNWKFHVAQRNVRLAVPELFDLKLDVAESYNLAAGHPDVVRELQGRILTALKTFPEEIQRANADPADKGKEIRLGVGSLLRPWFWRSLLCLAWFSFAMP